MEKEEIISYIRTYFPIESTEKVAKQLNLTSNMVRTLARKNNISKSPVYLRKLKSTLVKNRSLWYESNIPEFSPSLIQEQLIFGSLLGDGYISKGAKRSTNCYYQEHFGNKQRKYREWKLNILKDLGFSINGTFLRSKSHPYFTNLHSMLYQNNTKVITPDFLNKCIHPIFLTSLYLDDGSLVFSQKYNKSKHTVYCHPSIILYSLNFTPEENKQLASHLNHSFNTNFVVSGHPHGKGKLLKINKEQDVRNFLSIVKPYTSEIKSLLYKTDLNEKLLINTEELRKKYGNNVKIVLSSSERNKSYSQGEIKLIIELKSAGYTDQNIASRLGRSYWSVVYKIKELRKDGYLS